MERWIRTLTVVSFVACSAAVVWVNNENAKLEAMMAAHTVRVAVPPEKLREAARFEVERSAADVTTSFLQARRAELAQAS